MMGVSLTLVKRVSPLPAKFPTLSFTSTSESSFAALIAAATHKTHLHQFHARLILVNLLYLTTKLVNTASDLRLTAYARHLFDQIPNPNVCLDNAISRSYAKHHSYTDAVAMYSLMKHIDVTLDGFKLPHVLKALGELRVIELGGCVHGEALRRGFESDVVVVVGNSLVAFYAKFGRVEMGRRVFDEMGVKGIVTIVSQGSIVSGYVQNGEGREALRVFGAMRETSVTLDWIVMVSVVNACADLEDLRQGRCVHWCLVKMGLEDEVDLVVSLTAMYAKSGQVMVARLFFDEMERPDVMMWNAMISGYVKNGRGEEAVELFRGMVS